MVPAENAVLSLLALKLFGNARHSHVMSHVFDKGLARIVAIAPICAASNVRNLHGPALLLCGGEDTTIPCSGSVSALDTITTVPALVADYLTATHANWITRGNSDPSPIEVAALAWMRVQLMDDTSLRSMFYGASYTLCEDSTSWLITQNSLMDQ